MCGRFTRAKEILELEARFAVPFTAKNAAKKYNIAPSQKVPILVQKTPAQTECVDMTWGFLAPWSSEKKKTMMVNIRAETFEKPAFKKYLETGRCLVPADGFYEWQEAKGGKIPYRFILDSGLFGIAAIHREGTFCLITVEANSVVAPVHHRMPVIVPQTLEGAWLNPQSKPSDYKPILAPYAAHLMKGYPVSPMVNSGKIEDPHLIEPVENL